MATNFASELKRAILYCMTHKSDPMGLDIHVPYSILLSMRIFLSEYAQTHKEAIPAVRHELFSTSLETTIEQILSKVMSLGMRIDRDQVIIEECIKHALKYMILNYPCHLLWSPVNQGILHTNERVAAIDEQVRLTGFSYARPLYALKYGEANSLFTWDGSEWHITPIGNFFRTLSIPTGTVYLLLAELYFNTPTATGPFESNTWHMSKAFLTEVYRSKTIVVDVGEGHYSLSELDPRMEYLGRIGALGLIQSFDRTEERRGPAEVPGIPILYIADDYIEITMTDYGRDIIGRCLDERNELSSFFISNLVSYELSGKDYSYFTERESIDQLVELAHLHPEVAGDQTHVIVALHSSLLGGAPPITTLRSIPPTIEAILKNILVLSGHEDADSVALMTLRTICSKYENIIRDGKGIIQKDTLQYIQSMERNGLLHGNISPSKEFAAGLIDFMLNVLQEIYRNYADWAARRQSA